MEPALDIRSGMGAETIPQPSVTDDDAVRANTYGLLGALLASPPRRELFDLLANIEIPSADGLGTAWRVLRHAAERADVEAVDDEYHDLFVGMGRGELIPYGSWYLTGFVMDKPLAALRSDLAELRLRAAATSVKEPEDHAAALLETMALIAAAPEHEYRCAAAFLRSPRRAMDAHLLRGPAQLPSRRASTGR